MPKTEAVMIRRHRGDTFAIIPRSSCPRRSPFDIPGLNAEVTGLV